MKFAAFTTTTFFLLVNPGLVSGEALRTFTKDGSSMQEGELFRDDGPDYEHRNLGQLRSKQCAPMVEKMMKKAEEMVAKFTAEELKDFACNAVERKMKTDEEQEMEKDIKTQTDPCIKALEREMLKKKERVLQGMGSKEACEEELTKAFEAMEGEKEVGAVETSEDNNCCPYPPGSSGSDQDKCAYGNTLLDGYTYVYNYNRHDSDPVCGTSSCWCCRHPGNANTGGLDCCPFPPGTSGSNEHRCNVGNTLDDGYTYIYNVNRGTPEAACGECAGCYCCRYYGN